MNQHLVSIVLPVYNGARFLCQSVDSILSQTYTNFELIIVDDCSTDETPGIIEEYARKDRRVRTIRHSQNQYLPQALNTGFDAAKGVFLHGQAMTTSISRMPSNIWLMYWYNDTM